MYGHLTSFGGAMKLSMASFLADQEPSIVLD
jgi:hypothetical protein